LWILDESYDQHVGYVDSAAWAMGEFGAKGVEAFEVLGLFIDDMHESNTLIQEGNDLQQAANDAVGDTATLYQESVTAKINDLSTSIENFQMALANLLAGPLKGFLDVATDVVNELSGIPAGIEEREARGETIFAPPGGTMQPGINPAYSGGVGEKDTRFLDWFLNFLHDPFGLNEDQIFGDEEDPEEETSPAIRGRGRGGDIRNISNRRSSTRSSVTHNYITIMDNDSMLRGLLGVNINV
ncbi:MAG: hypothetical protein ACW98F_18115, partial [Candidatus Hodarchaeales archaeon]|jgi:hypothetical protein